MLRPWLVSGREEEENMDAAVLIPRVHIDICHPLHKSSPAVHNVYNSYKHHLTQGQPTEGIDDR